MRKMIAVLISSTLASLSLTAQAPSAPTAPPEAKRLAYFVGTWNFSGKANDSPMGPGGPITFKETCELMTGGFSIVCRSEGTTPMGPSKAVAIMGYDADKKSYSYTAAESNMPVITATGQTQGPVWTWTTISNMGGKPVTTRVTIKEGGPKAYDMAMEMSMDGKSFAPIMGGKATRP
jgi:hypothetical protein